MAGRVGRSGGSNKIDPSLHLMRGTYRPTRHAAALAASQGGAVWSPTEAELGGLMTAGQAFVARLRECYDLSPLEGEIAVEAGVIADRLDEIRRQRDGADLKVQLALAKHEQTWSKLLSALLLSLRSTRP